ncbi:MAG: nuclear transport factor 2 family protein [Candidatus Thorarchaeota archaeon]
MKPEEDEIKHALEVFIEGLRTLDYDKISEIFYEDGMSIGLRNGEITWVARNHWREMREQIIKAGQNPVDEWARFEIRSLEIIHNAASVIVDMWFGDGDTTKERYVDFFHMLKVGEKWRIVNKIYPSHEKSESTP